MKSFSLSVQGANHIKNNKICQDSSRNYDDQNCSIAIVCDGHGGNDYIRSNIGSRLGCNVAEKNIKEFITKTNKQSFFSAPEQKLKALESSIINNWNEAVHYHYNGNPFSTEELHSVSEKAFKKYTENKEIESAYGTTLIAVAMCSDYWFGIHIGDGKCVAVNTKGEFKQPIPWDSKCFLNATTSICDTDAIDNFRHFYSEKLPVAVFVGSDGIDDCFRNNEQFYHLYKTVLYSFATTNFDEACDSLKDYLPRLSAKGSGDDVSISAILDLNCISELSIVKEFDQQKEKARIEKNARKEAEKNQAEKIRIEAERNQAEKKRIEEEKKNIEQQKKQIEEQKKYIKQQKKQIEEQQKYIEQQKRKIKEEYDKNQKEKYYTIIRNLFHNNISEHINRIAKNDVKTSNIAMISHNEIPAEISKNNNENDNIDKYQNE